MRSSWKSKLTEVFLIVKIIIALQQLRKLQTD